MFKGYKTILINAAVAAATAGLAHFSPETVSEIFGPAYGPFAVMVLAGVNMALRAVTSTPVGKAA
jgi:hypothetical protein